METKDEQQVIDELLNDRFQRHNGTDQYYKHLFNIKYTDGVKAHAEIAKAQWLIDAIVSWQMDAKDHHDKHEGWMLWRLDVKNGSAVLTARADDNCEPFIRQDIEFTDHPSGQWEFWQEGDVLIIPEEH